MVNLFEPECPNCNTKSTYLFQSANTAIKTQMLRFWFRKNNCSCTARVKCLFPPPPWVVLTKKYLLVLQSPIGLDPHCTPPLDHCTSRGECQNLGSEDGYFTMATYGSCANREGSVVPAVAHMP